MSEKLSKGYSGFVHLVERRMLFHDEMAKLIRKHETAKLPYPFRFVTVTRDVGALGGAVAVELARCLQWKIYDKEIVDYIAENNHVLHGLVSQFDEKTQNRFQDSIERLLLMFHGQGFCNDVYHISLIQALLAIAGQGNCIILDHGAAYALQKHDGLHIRITASLPVRIRRLSRRWSIQSDRAEKIVQKIDRERAEFIQHHFMSDPDELNYFQLIFNSDKFPVDYIVSAIMGVMEQNDGSNLKITDTFHEATFSRDSDRIPLQAKQAV